MPEPFTEPEPSADPAAEAAALIAERLAELEAQRRALTATIDAVRTARSLTFTDDEHDPEGSTVSLDQAREVALLAGVEHALAQLHTARDRLADGDYGRCERCGRLIPSARLRVRPEARRCVPCS